MKLCKMLYFLHMFKCYYYCFLNFQIISDLQISQSYFISSSWVIPGLEYTSIEKGRVSTWKCTLPVAWLSLDAIILFHGKRRNNFLYSRLKFSFRYPYKIGLVHALHNPMIVQSPYTIGSIPLISPLLWK